MNTVTESFVLPRLMGNATYVRAYVRIPIGPLSVPRSTLLQMRRVRRYTQRKTLEDPEVPPFKTFKGGGKFGSNDIPLVNGGSSEDLLNIHMEIHMPREKRASQRRCQLIRKKIRTYVRTYVFGHGSAIQHIRGPETASGRADYLRKGSTSGGKASNWARVGRVHKNSSLPRGGVRVGRQRVGLCQMRFTTTPQTGAQCVQAERCKRRIRLCRWWQMIFILGNYQRCIG